ncbi:hypothetical protein DXU03_34835 [Rhizobium johnstonii]
MVQGVRTFFQLLWAVLYTDRSHVRVFFTTILIAPLAKYAARIAHDYLQIGFGSVCCWQGKVGTYVPGRIVHG